MAAHGGSQQWPWTRRALAPDADRPASNHHALAAHEVLLLLESDPDAGLSERDAEARLREYGRNELPRIPTAGPLRRLVRQFQNPLIVVLVVAGLMALILGELVDSSVIVGVVAVNAVIGFLQESRAESALDALRTMVQTSARVIRGGHRRVLDSEELVPGDVVVVEAGDKVPADLRIIRQADLRVDESALTGESLPVAKHEIVLPPSTPVADRRNIVYSGTLVTGGTGRGIVVATGGGTELGEIHRLVGTTTGLTTPLTRKLSAFSAWLTGVILALAAGTFAIGVARGQPMVDMFTAAVALAVGAIPEGLPAAATITLAIGVSRMARRGAIVRRLPAVETLGSATVICTDKTGTLTENRMAVRALWSVTGGVELGADTGEDLERVSTDAALRWCLTVGANCNDARLSAAGDGVGDPTETAMLVVARQLGIAPHAMSRTGVLPFSSERRFMATTQVDPEDDREVLMVKGAVERVLALSRHQMTADGRIVPIEPIMVEEVTERFASRGMRVLATAVCWNPPPELLTRLDDAQEGDLVLVGLQAMLDPPRSTAPTAVRTCRRAGLAVKMITGDHAATAESISRQIGILDDDSSGGVLTGVELAEIDDEDLPDAVEDAVVFARVSPSQKLRIVQALQSRHHVVAMTGDGVNDAPALKQADIGIAMGLMGTEVAKDAGDMVLTDDDFATIEAAVEEGRGVFDNLIKFIVWTLPTNMGEGMVILVAILLGATLPILPTQILWINMTTAVALGLTLAWEAKEPDIMERPPRDPRRSLLTGPIVFRTMLLSALLVAGTWWVFEFEQAQGASLEASRTASVNVFVTVEAFYLFSCRSLSRPVWRTGMFTNRALLIGVAVQILGQAAITYLPAMNTLFQTAPVRWQGWVTILGVATVASVVVALDKRRLRGRAL